MENFIGNASGTLGQARAMIIQQVQQIKITAQNYHEVQELLEFADKIDKLRVTLEVVAHRYGDTAQYAAMAATAASAARRARG